VGGHPVVKNPSWGFPTSGLALLPFFPLSGWAKDYDYNFNMKAVAFPRNSNPDILGIPSGDEFCSVLNKWQLNFFFPSLCVVL